jgi:hypothetical protein
VQHYPDHDQLGGASKRPSRLTPWAPLVRTSANGQGLSEHEFEAQWRRLRLEKGEFELLRQRVLLGLVVVFAITTVASAAVGLHWPVPATTGGGGITTWIASEIESRRRAANPDDISQTDPG